VVEVKRGRDWTCQEEAALRVLAPLGSRTVALVLDRGLYGVEVKASRMGVSLKKRLEINDRFLTTPMLEAIKRHNPGVLCPACGKALQATRNGLCGACHLEALAEAQNAAYRELVANREYNVAKARLKRKRKELGVAAPRARGGDAEA